MKIYYTRFSSLLLMLGVLFGCLYGVQTSVGILEGLSSEEVSSIPEEFLPRIEEMSGEERSVFMSCFMKERRSNGIAYSLSFIFLEGFYVKGRGLMAGITFTFAVLGIVCGILAYTKPKGLLSLLQKVSIVRDMEHLFKGAGVFCLGVCLILRIVTWATLYKYVEEVNRASFEEQLAITGF